MNDSKTVPTAEEKEEDTSASPIVSKDPQRTPPPPPATTNTTNDGDDNFISHVLYISIFAMFGSIIRIFLSKLFTKECEVTSGLFSDLPPNVLGSFLMGTITPIYHYPAPAHHSPSTSATPASHSPTTKKRVIPWFHAEHPLQYDVVFHASLGVGFCGCLTTFASWNSAMVELMYGSRCGMSNQVVAGLFGYALGLIVSISSFRFGRDVSHWIHHRFEKKLVTTAATLDDEAGEDVEGNLLEKGHLEAKNHDDVDNNNQQQQQPPEEATTIKTGQTEQDTTKTNDPTSTTETDEFTCLGFRPMHFIFPFIGLLIALFVWADVGQGIFFYREMYMSAVLSPPGALLRWTLAGQNSVKDRRYLPWLPWGTFASNMLGATVSIMCAGFTDRYITASLSESWAHAMLYAVQVGFAGSLSTVSSMVKEFVLISEKHPGEAKSYFYGWGTCFGGMVIGLCLYALIVFTP